MTSCLNKVFPDLLSEAGKTKTSGMIELALISLQLFFLVLRYQRRNAVSILLCIYTVSVLPTAVVGDRSAFLKVEKGEDDKLFSGETTTKFGEGDPSSTVRLLGSFARAGSVKSAEGLLHKIPAVSCDGEEEDLDRSLRSVSLSREWVAVLELPAGSSNTDPNPSHCQSVLDRVRKVMLFGASAIIILAMNPKMVTELDISQLFPRPVVIIQDVENVTALLSALASKIKMKVRLTYNASFYDLQKITTLTLWATCGRSSGVRSYSEFDGVICLGNQHEDVSKADPALFWSYFFSGLSFLLLLFMIKAKHGTEDSRHRTQSAEQCLQRLTNQAIHRMKVRRYKHNESRNHDDGDRDTCAVCLDAYRHKQKIRVMPCFHEFHVGCVDPWLRLHQTCPLCKLNIIDQQIKLSAL